MTRRTIGDIEVFELEALPEKQPRSVRDTNQYLLAMCCTTLLLEMSVAFGLVGAPQDTVGETSTQLDTTEVTTVQTEP